MQITVAMRTIEILGQVLRDEATAPKLPEKLSVADQVFRLGRTPVYFSEKMRRGGPTILDRRILLGPPVWRLSPVMGVNLNRRLRKRAKYSMPPAKRKPASDREREFIINWANLGGPRLEAQFQFHPTRRWKFDWAHLESRVAIEIQGGTWLHKSRHVSGTGYWGDRIKMNAALRLDWKVFELTSQDISDERVLNEIKAEIEARMQALPLARDGLTPFADVYPDRKPRRAA